MCVSVTSRAWAALCWASSNSSCCCSSAVIPSCQLLLRWPRSSSSSARSLSRYLNTTRRGHFNRSAELGEVREHLNNGVLPSLNYVCKTNSSLKSVGLFYSQLMSILYLIEELIWYLTEHVNMFHMLPTDSYNQTSFCGEFLPQLSESNIHDNWTWCFYKTYRQTENADEQASWTQMCSTLNFGMHLTAAVTARSCSASLQGESDTCAISGFTRTPTGDVQHKREVQPNSVSQRFIWPPADIQTELIVREQRIYSLWFMQKYLYEIFIMLSTDGS